MNKFEQNFENLKQEFSIENIKIKFPNEALEDLILLYNSIKDKERELFPFILYDIPDIKYLSYSSDEQIDDVLKEYKNNVLEKRNRDEIISNIKWWIHSLLLEYIFEIVKFEQIVPEQYKSTTKKLIERLYNNFNKNEFRNFEDLINHIMNIFRPNPLPSNIYQNFFNEKY